MSNNFTIYASRVACGLVGSGLAAVGMLAIYKAAAAVGNDYLMVAGPLVALAAPITAIFMEIAHEHRQWLKMLALLIAFGLCGAVVFFTASERNHDGRAVGEATRLASRTAADRADRDLVAAKAAASAKTAIADKTRGLDEKHCRKACLSDRANEVAAKQAVRDAEQAVRDASKVAVTDSGIQQADWLMPLAVDFSSVVLLWLAFSLGKTERKEVAPLVVEKIVEIEVPAQPAKPVKLVNPARSAAARLGHQRRREREAAVAKSEAIASRKVVAIG
jgi:hypothetical protein